MPSRSSSFCRPHDRRRSERSFWTRSSSACLSALGRRQSVGQRPATDRCRPEAGAPDRRVRGDQIVLSRCLPEAQDSDEAPVFGSDPSTMDPPWTNEHQDAAQHEGWIISECFGSAYGPWQLQRLDDASDVPGATQLRYDASAWDIVLKGTGSHHKAALAFIQAHNPMDYKELLGARAADRRCHDRRRAAMSRLATLKAVEGYLANKADEPQPQHSGVPDAGVVTQ